jgi:hypothetical protein
MERSSCGCGQVTQIEAAPAAPGELGTEMGWRDVLGGWRVRWGIARSRYRVSPGLYRVGRPDADSPVLATANYKLSVDAVRRELGGLDVWLMVLDTKGVNVWCAAAKGTFGTGELVGRIRATGLAQVVRHRRLILPQLGAVGVAAHKVKQATGFSVLYGPVRARDIPAYLAAGRKATPEMRRVAFGWKERVVLAPNELVGAWKLVLGVFGALALLDLLGHRQAELAADAAPFAAAFLTGGVVVPLLLPWLPFRAFALKGAVAGAAVAAAATVGRPLVEGAGTALAVVAIVSFMAMVFTGSSTFTTLAGVRREVRVALPLIVAAAGVGAAMRVAAAFL